MRNLFYKQMFRELKLHKIRYILLMVILAMALTLVGGNIISSNNISDQIKEYFGKNNVEDGEFRTLLPLSEKTLSELNDMGVVLEKKFYTDYSYNDDSVIRAYCVRDKINTINLIKGDLPQAENEVLLEKKYAEANNLLVGDDLKIGSMNFKITGIGTVPDYTSVKKNIEDLKNDSAKFGLLFLTDKGYEALSEVGQSIQNEVYEYAYLMGNSNTYDKLKNYLDSVEFSEQYESIKADSILISIVATDDNERITGYENDLNTTLAVSIFMAILLAILIAFIIAVFISHTIDEQSVEIGTLYAMGIWKKEILRQYMLLPGMVIFAGGGIGVALGYLICGISTANNAANYSYPEIEYQFYPIVLLYGIILPVITGVLINYLVISRKLNAEPLELLRKYPKKIKTSKIKIKSENFDFIYQIRQVLREKVVYILLFAGCFYALCILLFAFTMFAGINNYVQTSTKDVTWKYMYILNGIQNVNAEDDETEQALMKTVSAYNIYSGENQDITLLGIENNSKYFEFPLECEKDEIIISDCVEKKFDWKKGEKVILTNKKDNSKREYKIKEIVEYSALPTIFMPEKNLRNIYDLGETGYNVLFADKEMDEMDRGLIQNVTSRNDIDDAGKNLLNNMKVTICVSLGGAIIVFIAVLYLLLKHVIDKTSFSISLMKIFGYSEREISKIFIVPNRIVVMLASVLAILVGKPIIDKLYPNLITDIDVGLDYHFEPVIYACIIAIILVSYTISMKMLKRKLKNVEYTEVLKERE